MPLQPGPFLQVSQDALGFNTVKYDFAGEADTDTADLVSIGASMDTLLDGVELFAGGIDDPLADIDIDAALTAAATLASQTDPASLTLLSLFTSFGDSQLSISLADTPAEAFLPDAPVFIPPDTSRALAVPTLDASLFVASAATPATTAVPVTPGAPTSTPTTPSGSPGVVSINTGGGGNETPPPTPVTIPVTPGNSAAGVSISNNTRIGQANFWVGDDFTVTITSPVAGDVRVDDYFQGALYSSADIGTVQANVPLVQTGYMEPGYVGAWKENYYVNGQLIGTLNFVVLAAN